jgi:hypothetical protein
MARSLPPSVAGSVWLYRHLLRAFPGPFRDSYRPEMVQVFRDLCWDAYRCGGAVGIIALWGASLGDLLINLVEELSREPRSMPARSLWRGLPYGLALGGGLSLYQLFSLFIVQEALRDNTVWRLVPPALLALCALAGFASARQTGQWQAGIMTGLGVGLVGALIFDLTMLLSIVAGLEALRHIPAEVSDYLRSGAPSFAEYQITEALGGSFYLLLLGPTLGALLGLVSGLAGKAWLQLLPRH